MTMTLLEIKYGLLGIVGLAGGLMVLLMLISGVHLLAREIGRSMRRKRRTARKQSAAERLYAGAGD